MANQYKMAYHSGPYRIENYKEGTTGQTFVVGDLVVLHAEGRVEANASGDAITLGIALNDATATAGGSINVLVILPTTQLVTSVYHATAASAVTAQAQVGNNYDLYAAAGSGAYIDIGNTSDNIVQVLGLLPDDAIATQYGRVLVSFIPSALQSEGAAQL